MGCAGVIPGASKKCWPPAGPEGREEPSTWKAEVKVTHRAVDAIVWGPNK